MSTVFDTSHYIQLVTTLYGNATSSGTNIYNVPNYPANESWYVQGFVAARGPTTTASYQQNALISITSGGYLSSNDGFAVRPLRDNVYAYKELMIELSGGIGLRISRHNNEFMEGFISGHYSEYSSGDEYSIIQLNNVHVQRNTSFFVGIFTNTTPFYISYYLNIYKEVYL